MQNRFQQTQFQNSYSFRPVHETDLPLICSFPQSVQELFFMFPKAVYPLTPAQLQAAIEQRWASTVMVKAEAVVGFANFYQCEPGVRAAIGNFVIAPQRRGEGYGRALLAEMVRKAFMEQAARVVEISCFNLNTAGLLLYSRFGFAPVMIEQRVNWAGEPILAIHFHLAREAWLEKQA